jgi:hypothetical protein
MAKSWSSRGCVAGLAAAVLASFVLVPAGPAAAGKDHGKHDKAPKVVARGLDNPRHVRVAGDALYVAESGVGGRGPCISAGEDEQACYGNSGAITRIRNGRQARVVTGLPSLAETGGTNASGPADVRVRGRNYTVALGLGAAPSERAKLPPRGQRLATVSVGRFGRPGLRVVADVARYEARVNPDGRLRDTNPTGLVQRRGRSYVVDAGGNSLLRYRAGGRISTTAVFPQRNVLAPSPPLPPGTRVDMDAVPTAAAVGPDGALYVSQLTGFPFPVGGANIWRVVPGRAPTRYVTGLTNVTDLAFGRDGSLYVVQIADQGLLAGESARGSVRRIKRNGARSVVIGNLVGPYGIALSGKSAYVTTCSFCADGGQVLKVPLR